MDEVFVLLDDCAASAALPSSRLYCGFVHEHRCTDPATLDTVWAAVVRDQQQGLHAAVLADYEWGAKLQRAGLATLEAGDASALRVLMFHQCQQLDAQAVADWLAQAEGQATPGAAGIADWRSTVDAPAFDAAVARIRQLIGQGESYQVNFTRQLQGQHYGHPIALYRRLRAMQPVPFGALLRLPDAAATDPQWVLSCSPELFVRNQAGRLQARPMKGTAARQTEPAADAQQAAWLGQDTKNRAENVMIVDLLRNDLGRIAETGSVRVPALFAVESHRTVHQMTSTVEAQARADIGFAGVLRALFPCGSITGAPKLHSMDLIADLEATPRGLYCGAIGWVDAPPAGAALGDFCLSVAIRTLLLGPERNTRRSAALGVGSGIVLDSRATDEFDETCTKARFVTQMDPGFSLFETMRVQGGRIRHLRWHLQRLQASAQTLGFAYDAAAVQQALQQCLQAMADAGPYRLRLDVQHGGGLQCRHAALPALPPGPAGLLLCDEALPASERVLLQHKTSLRSHYDAAIQAASALGAFDAIYVNARGEVSEGARSTLLVHSQGRWWTPPLGSGVLAGVQRARLLARCPALGERVLTLDEALAAPRLAVCSALRGVRAAQWLRDADGAVRRLRPGDGGRV